jgi:hypothetical protein
MGGGTDQGGGGQRDTGFEEGTLFHVISRG